MIKTESLIFPVHYFYGVKELKSVAHSLENELNKELIGDVRVMFAMKKRSSIGNCAVRNKQLSLPDKDFNNQRSNGKGWCTNLMQNVIHIHGKSTLNSLIST